MNKLVDIKPGMRQEEIAKAYSDHLGLPMISLKGKKIPENVLEIIPKNIALENKIIAYELTKDKTPILKLAVADPEKLQSKAPVFLVNLKKQKGYNFQMAIITLSDFDYALDLYKKEPPKPPKEAPKPPKEEHQEDKKPLQAFKGTPPASLINKFIAYEVLNKFPEDVARKYRLIVFESSDKDNSIKVAAENPDSQQVKDILNFIEKRNDVKIEVFKTTSKDIDYALKLYQQTLPTPRAPKLEEKAQAESDKNEAIPLAKPIPELDKKPVDQLPPLKKENLQPLKEKPIKTEAVDKNKEKPAEVKSEEVGDIELHEDNYKPFVSEDMEKNLNNLLPAGIKDLDSLSAIIKGGVIPKIVAAIIFYAVESEASDIHLEPTAKDYRLRYRIDGVLKDLVNMPLSLHLPIVSRIKILSNLKIDEQRVPQDGRFDVIVGKKNIDLRVSTLPTVHGEKVVMRILDKSASVKNLEDLGFTGTNLKRVSENISKPYGIILATGPTGSGKSTTLYAILNKISNPEVNIITLEDPVEYEIAGINQCQIRPKIGFTFADGLRSILRQDPNIIMVGEIRDAETASMATHAALTGHLVLTTLHTNDAAGALPRLINMGIEPFLVTSAINCIIAQRLVRKICEHCKTEVKLPAPTIDSIKKTLAESKNKEVLDYKDKEMKFFKGKGCAYCSHGYKGRVGIYEVLPITNKIEDLAVHKRPASEIQKQAIEEEMVTMKQDGIIKAIKGITTIDEILRATSD
ncbi:MAG: type II/IV secretion system protein [Patescibacteria group bacterium]|nr:type II/IV secretion system protein [Patescibacteria group bacterium]